MKKEKKLYARRNFFSIFPLLFINIVATIKILDYICKENVAKRLLYDNISLISIDIS